MRKREFRPIEIDVKKLAERVSDKTFPTLIGGITFGAYGLIFLNTPQDRWLLIGVIVFGFVFGNWLGKGLGIE